MALRRLSERIVGLETEQKEIQETQDQNWQQPAPQVPQGLGTFLKSERERLGLSQLQITERTRIRAVVIEAIEKEDWRSLPPPVFVRGFLRSYAKALGLSQESVIGLYEKTAPREPSGQIPRREPSGHGRRSAWLVLLLLAAGIAVYSVWSFYPFSQIDDGPRGADNRTPEPAPAPPQPVAATPRPARAAEEPLKQEPAPAVIKAQEPPAAPKESESPARDQAGDDGWFSLTGIVKERTWLRITIDGKEEREYLLQPGSRPQWRAKESFYMLIGNAAGIDFDLNGKRVGGLGNPGQVIRLTLPKGAPPRERAN